MSRTYRTLSPDVKEYRKYVFKQEHDNGKLVFKEKFNELLKKQEKQYTLFELAELLGRERTTINNWKQGHTLPGKETIRMIEEKFNAPGHFRQMNLFQRELTSPRHHQEMNAQAAAYGEMVGISETFVRYLRNNKQIADRICNLQPTDAVLNSFDLRVLHMNLPYQFSTKIGERIYLNPYMINILRVLQDEVEQFINKKLNEYEPIIDQEYKKGGSIITDPSCPAGYFRQKVHELNK